MERIEERIALLRELVSCVYNLYFTEYDTSFNVNYCSAPHGNILHLLFSLDMTSGKYSEIADEIKNRTLTFDLGKPFVVTNSIGMVWISDIERLNGVPIKIHVLGPAFTDDYSIKAIENRLEKLDLTGNLKTEFMDTISDFPVISMVRFFEYGIMLHYCLTCEKMTISEFTYLNLSEKDDSVNESRVEPNHGTYIAEQKMLKFVREGNLKYQKEMDRLASFGNLGKLANGDYIRQVKNSVIVFTALCCRAAILGGLSPETAYLLSDRYIQNTESCDTLSELAEINHAMLDDYIHRVYRLKTDVGISPQIRTCSDYISLYPEKKLDIHDLASKLGYTDYYFTKKFKRETGFTVKEFATQQKIEKAKVLLKDNNLNVADISDTLGFSSQSYFGEIFRKNTGLSPSEYRAKIPQNRAAVFQNE